MSMYLRDRTPYLYGLVWTEHNIGYVGVRYGKNCHPDDLWHTYFTSSTKVEQFRAAYGEPDQIEIIDRFLTIEQAMDAEMEAIRDFELHLNPVFLNRSGSFYAIWNEDTRADHSERMTIILNKPDVRQKLSESAKARAQTESYRKAFSARAKGMWQDDEHRRIASERWHARMKKYHYQGVDYTIYDLALMTGLHKDTITYRDKQGWSVDRIVETPFRGRRKGEVPS